MSALNHDIIVTIIMNVKVPGGKRRIAEGRRAASKKGRYTEVSFFLFCQLLTNLVHRGMLFFLAFVPKKGGEYGIIFGTLHFQ